MVHYQANNYGLIISGGICTWVLWQIMRGMMTYSCVSTLVCIFVLNISLFTLWFKTAHNMKKVTQVISGEPVCISSASPFLYFAGFNNLKIQQRNSLQRIVNLAPKQSVIKLYHYTSCATNRCYVSKLVFYAQKPVRLHQGDNQHRRQSVCKGE